MDIQYVRKAPNKVTISMKKSLRYTISILLPLGLIIGGQQKNMQDAVITGSILLGMSITLIAPSLKKRTHDQQKKHVQTLENF